MVLDQQCSTRYITAGNRQTLPSGGAIQIRYSQRSCFLTSKYRCMNTSFTLLERQTVVIAFYIRHSMKELAASKELVMDATLGTNNACQGASLELDS